MTEHTSLRQIKSITAGVEGIVKTVQKHLNPTPVKMKPLALKNYCTEVDSYDFLNQKSIDESPCQHNSCGGSSMFPPQLFNFGGKLKSKKNVQEESLTFLTQYYTEINKRDTQEFTKRMQQVNSEIDERGTYELTYDELAYGAKQAWRNAARCIGRISWQKLQVFDRRHVKTTQEMYEAMCTHLEYASNNGQLRSAITVFPQRTDPDKEFRVWNKQMISYAGYRQPDGSVIGDPINAAFTEVCQKLGWEGAGTRFDILPLVLQANGEDPDVFPVPEEYVLEVNLEHPKYPWFAEMGLKWYGLPGVSGMLFDCGGVEFCGAPFSGWYLVTEIAARDLCDINRYNILEEVGLNMGLNTLADSTLWKDRVAIEVTDAVLYSFHKKNVTITDHHTAAQSFMAHYEQETRVRGGCPTDWVWVVPPIGGSLTPVFHQEFSNYQLKPSFSYQVDRWKTHVWKNQALSDRSTSHVGFRPTAKSVLVLQRSYKKAIGKRVPVSILFATETGRSQTYAKKLGDFFWNAFRVTISCMDDYDISSINNEKLLFIVAATTGNGDPPENAQKFVKKLKQMKEKSKAHGGKMKLKKLQYGVFALGSRAYKNFCSFGTWVDSSLGDLGANRIQDVVMADELTGQDMPFKNWSAKMFKICCQKYYPAVLMSETVRALFSDCVSVSPGRVRFFSKPSISYKTADNETAKDYFKVHGKNVHQTIVSRNYELYDDNNNPTIAVELKTSGNKSLEYKPGDHVAIFPTNRDDLVNAILIYLKDVRQYWDTPTQFQFFKTYPGTNGKWEDHERMPFVSVRTLLTKFLDITTPASTELLEALANMSKDEVETKKLKELALNLKVYEEWKKQYHPHLLEVLEAFPSAARNLNSAVVLGHLPLLTPRFYSISSSPDLYSNQIHLTVAVVTYKTDYGRGNLHYGVCTNYLRQLTVGDQVNCYVRSAPSFHLPEDSSAPVIMVGPGSGIAPLRSFWQQRLVENRKKADGAPEKGPISLFVGSQRKEMLLYDEEIRKMTKENVITDRFVALSREPTIPKTYVQHKMMEVADDIYKKITKQQAHVYVCGSHNMADDVRSTIVKIIQKEGEMEETEATDILTTMKEAKRYHEDLFGTKIPSNVVTEVTSQPKQISETIVELSPLQQDVEVNKEIEPSVKEVKDVIAEEESQLNGVTETHSSLLYKSADSTSSSINKAGQKGLLKTAALNTSPTTNGMTTEKERLR